MGRPTLRSALAAVLVMAAVSSGACVSAAEKEKFEAFTDPALAGPDYQTQGEYTGSLRWNGEPTRCGVQVVALGDGKFDAVLCVGGLPGDGWKRGDERLKASGQTSAEATTFKSDKWTGKLVNSSFEVFGSGGESLGSLPKVERASPTLGAAPPAGAIVLFDGQSGEQFEKGTIVEGNLLLAGDASKQKFGDCDLHLEFRTPFVPKARGQARGNSGMYLQSRYEVQVLDSFGLEGKNNECGGIYKIAEPLVNMCFPPLRWQTYDVHFTAARYEGDKKVTNARATIRHNGVVIHDDLELPEGTPGRLKEGPGPAPLYLQDHGNPVVYRNIWVTPLN